MFIGCGVALLVLLFTGIKGCSDEKDRNTQSSSDSQYSYSDDSYSDDNDNNYSNEDNDNNYTSSGYIGNNYIEIVDYRFGETEYDRDPVIIVTYNYITNEAFVGEYTDYNTYNYTNYSNEVRSYDNNLIDNVYQNGIQLEKELYHDIRNEEIDYSMSDRKIQPGTTITFDKVYELQNDYDDVDVEVTPILSTSNSDKVSKTFYLE